MLECKQFELLKLCFQFSVQMQTSLLFFADLMMQTMLFSGKQVFNFREYSYTYTERLIETTTKFKDLIGYQKV